MTTHATLPRELVIDGIVHVEHWRSQDLIIYQNYTSPRATSDQPLQDRTPQIIGSSMFHLYRITRMNPGEALGEKLGSYSDLNGAIAAAVKQGLIA
jgi:hypothetical protein